MLVKRITACIHLSSFFNRFPAIQHVHVQTFAIFAPFLHILASLGTIAVNVIRLERGFNACKTPRCIYPSIFNYFWDIASYWSNIATFSYPILCLAAPQGVTPSEFREDLYTHKTRMNGLSCGEENMTNVQPFWNNTSGRRTDRQTDWIGIARRASSIAADARKNIWRSWRVFILQHLAISFRLTVDEI